MTALPEASNASNRIMVNDLPTTPTRISVQIQPQHATYERMRQAWIEADDIGVDVVFTWDHFHPLYGDPDGLRFECYMLLGAMAEVVERARIGPLVTCNSHRNPNLLADMARTVDHLSGGRLILGMGSGWEERDYVEYGYEFGTHPSRLRDLDRDLPIIRDRLGKLNPAPVNGTIPILIGGSGEKVTLRLVATHADIWHAHEADPETLGHKACVLEEWCAKFGRDPAGIERMTNARTDDLTANDDLHSAGFTHLVVGMCGPDYDLGVVRELVQWRDGKNRPG